jgi:hypothetical protein
VQPPLQQQLGAAACCVIRPPVRVSHPGYHQGKAQQTQRAGCLYACWQRGNCYYAFPGSGTGSSRQAT